MRVFLASVLLPLVACNPPGVSTNAPDAGTNAFTFQIWVSPIPDDVTSVTVNGVAVAIVPVHRALASIQFPDYATTIGQAIEVDSYTNQTMTHVGHTLVGLCAECRLSTCPTIDELVDESVEFQSGPDFTMSDTTCYNCSGGGKDVAFCE